MKLWVGCGSFVSLNQWVWPLNDLDEALEM